MYMEIHLPLLHLQFQKVKFTLLVNVLQRVSYNQSKTILKFFIHRNEYFVLVIFFFLFVSVSSPCKNEVSFYTC